MHENGTHNLKPGVHFSLTLTQEHLAFMHARFMHIYHHIIVLKAVISSLPSVHVIITVSQVNQSAIQLQLNYKTCYLSGGFVVQVWWGYHNVPRVGPHPRHTSATL